MLDFTYRSLCKGLHKSGFWIASQARNDGDIFRLAMTARLTSHQT